MPPASEPPTEVTGVHDVSDGGLLVALAEMAMAGNVGMRLKLPDGLPVAPHAWLFGEDQARYVVLVEDDALLLDAAQSAMIPAVRLGRTGGDMLSIEDVVSVSVAILRKAHEDWLPSFMAGPQAA